MGPKTRKESKGSAAKQSRPEPAVTNLILNAIPANEYQLIQTSLEPVTMDWHVALHNAKEPIEFGYFPNGGVISLVVPMADGRSAEVGMVGREGFVGAVLAGGLDRSPHQALVQASSTAMRIRASLLQKILPSIPQLWTLLTRYAIVQGMQLAQTAACNRLHNLEQRLARWLLMSHDRVRSQVLPYTQDLLAIVLGTDRPSVSVAVGILQKKGCIKQKRGVINIVDRTKLKVSTCECYGVIQAFNRELDPELL
ncbi:MAG TPA: Crp/Fnr family transcriptional regulator [Candidatus Angelobacter sp.]|nr:Crp/Fnr family transcriptional regulator [Candidatus Angelobacter sp.]